MALNENDIKIINDIVNKAIEAKDIRRQLSIVENQLLEFIGIDKYSFQKDLKIFNAKHIQLGRDYGTKLGTATDQKLGLWGTTPVIQPVTVSNPGNVGVTYSQAEVQAIVDAVKAIIARLKEPGIIA